MSEMLDRIAQAIYDNARNGVPVPLRVCYQYASVALDAMRVPTDEMTEPEVTLRFSSPVGIYAAMIDAAARIDT